MATYRWILSKVAIYLIIGLMAGCNVQDKIPNGAYRNELGIVRISDSLVSIKLKQNMPEERYNTDTLGFFATGTFFKSVFNAYHVRLNDMVLDSLPSVIEITDSKSDSVFEIESNYFEYLPPEVLCINHNGVLESSIWHDTIYISASEKHFVYSIYPSADCNNMLLNHLAYRVELSPNRRWGQKLLIKDYLPRYVVTDAIVKMKYKKRKELLKLRINRESYVFKLSN